MAGSLAPSRSMPSGMTAFSSSSISSAGARMPADFLELMDEPAVTCPGRPTTTPARASTPCRPSRPPRGPPSARCRRIAARPDLLVWSVELIIKPPQSDKMLTMHQDLNYWAEHADGEVTAWLYSVMSPSRTGRCSSYAIASAPSPTTTRMGKTSWSRAKRSPSTSTPPTRYRRTRRRRNLVAPRPDLPRQRPQHH